MLGGWWGAATHAAWRGGGGRRHRYARWGARRCCRSSLPATVLHGEALAALCAHKGYAEPAARHAMRAMLGELRCRAS